MLLASPGVGVFYPPWKLTPPRDLGHAAGQFQDRGPAEAVADGGDAPGISQFMLDQHLQPSLDLRPQEGSVVLVFTRSNPGVLGVGGPNPLAVDVHGEDVVAQLRQHTGALLFVVAQPRPLVDNQHGRPSA